MEGFPNILGVDEGCDNLDWATIGEEKQHGLLGILEMEELNLEEAKWREVGCLAADMHLLSKQVNSPLPFLNTIIQMHLIMIRMLLGVEDAIRLGEAMFSMSMTVRICSLNFGIKIGLVNLIAVVKYMYKASIFKLGHGTWEHLVKVQAWRIAVLKHECVYSSQ